MSDAAPDPKPAFLVKVRGAIGTARSDFMCNSKTCRTKKGARVYTLPAVATRCSVCGSKRIVKLMAAPHISNGIAKRSDRVMERGYSQQRRVKDDAREAQQQHPMFAVSSRGGLAGAVAEGMAKAGHPNHPVPWGADPMGGVKPTVGITSPVLTGAKASGMVKVPTDVVAKWTPPKGTR